MEKKKVNRTNIAEHLFDYQLEIIGKTRINVVDDDRWHHHFSITRTQYSEFSSYAIKLMMKTFRCNKTKAIANFEWYWSQFSVKIRDK